KERDGMHVKELGKGFLKLFKRKKKKDALLSPPLPFQSPILPPPPNSKGGSFRPVSFRIHNLPATSPTYSEMTQHSADTRSGHVVNSTTSLTEVTSGGGATSADTMDHENSVEDNKKRETRAERRAYYRSIGVHVVADEDDHTEFEESQGIPFRVDRRIIDRLQWKDGVVPVDFTVIQFTTQFINI
ncbi:hypothetical protein PMAYCL1PPCAC_24272, partial [Pristionchus mayeri]